MVDGELYLNGVKLGSPCFKEGTKVLTREGYKEIQDICIGDEVLTHMNRWRKVKCVDNSAHQEIWKIKTRNGFKCYVTVNHHLMASKVEGKHFSPYKFIRVGELGLDNYLMSLVKMDGSGEVDYEYDKIIKIERTDRNERVYNLGVAEDYTYIVNGKIVQS